MIREQPVLIVGGGPVGLCTAMLLDRLGVRSILFERHPGTAVHPKAAGINQRTMEVFRDLGLSAEIDAAAADRRWVGRTAWYTSFGGPTPLHGRRIAVRDAWGGGAYAAEYAAAGPELYTMLSQIRLEPILRAAAERRPLADVRFGWEVVDLGQDDDGVWVDVVDDGGRTHRIAGSHLVAADGGRTVAARVGIGETGPTDLVDMVTAHVTADLSAHVPDRGVFINWFVNPDLGGSIGSGYLSPIGPWDEEGRSREFSFACAFRADDPVRFDADGMVQRIGRSLGVGPLQLEVHSVSHWHIQSVIADDYRAGRVFLVGDAAHRIPPWGALGMNTGIQDAANLTWKLAAAIADPRLAPLLDSYEVERRPVALSVAASSLDNFRSHAGSVDVALGLEPGLDPAEGWRRLAQLWADGPEGAARRAALDEAMRVLDREFHAHGVELGYSYPRGALAVQTEADPQPADPVVHVPTLAVGHHLPHAWVGPGVSSLDAEPGRWRLLVGADAAPWHAALARTGSPLRDAVDVVEVRGTDGRPAPGAITSDGLAEHLHGRAALVRPDGFVAWVGGGAETDGLDPALAAVVAGR